MTFSPIRAFMYVILNNTIFDSFKYGKMFYCRIKTEDPICLWMACLHLFLQTYKPVLILMYSCLPVLSLFIYWLLNELFLLAISTFYSQMQMVKMIIHTAKMLVIHLLKHQLRYLSKDKRINKMWRMYMLGFYSVLRKKNHIVFRKNGWN